MIEVDDDCQIEEFTKLHRRMQDPGASATAKRWRNASRDRSPDLIPAAKSPMIRSRAPSILEDYEESKTSCSTAIRRPVRRAATPVELDSERSRSTIGRRRVSRSKNLTHKVS